VFISGTFDVSDPSQDETINVAGSDPSTVSLVASLPLLSGMLAQGGTSLSGAYTAPTGPGGIGQFSLTNIFASESFSGQVNGQLFQETSLLQAGNFVSLFSGGGSSHNIALLFDTPISASNPLATVLAFVAGPEPEAPPPVPLPPAVLLGLTGFITLRLTRKS
jgi:hypothetical protein